MGPPPRPGTTVAITAPVPVPDNPLRPIKVRATEAVEPTSPREVPSPGAVGTADLRATVGVRATFKDPAAVREVQVPQVDLQVHPVPVGAEIDLNRSVHNLNP